MNNDQISKLTVPQIAEFIVRMTLAESQVIAARYILNPKGNEYPEVSQYDRTAYSKAAFATSMNAAKRALPPLPQIVTREKQALY